MSNAEMTFREWRGATAAALIILILTGTLPASGQPKASRRASVTLRDGTSVFGDVESVQDDTLNISNDAPLTHHTLADVVAIDFDDRQATVKATPDRWLLLAGGDRAPLTPFDLDDDYLVCAWSGERRRAAWRVPMQFVTAALFQPLAPTGDAASRVPELSFQQFREDTLILRDGTQLTGVLEDVAAESVRIETAVGPVAVEAARVDAIALDAALVQQPAAQESLTLLITRDGAWLTLLEWSVDQTGELTGRSSIGVEIRIPLADVARIACYGPRVLDLTQRPPVMTKVTPFLAREEKLLVNRNVRGGFLRLDGRECPRGFGMTSGMSATFALEPKDRKFFATVGLDDMVGDDGSVVFAVDLDGRRVFTSPMMTGADPAFVVGPLDIAGKKTLTLSVDFADYGNVQDVANWCDPVLLR